MPGRTDPARRRLTEPELSPVAEAGAQEHAAPGSEPTLLALQRSAGNAAVARMLGGRVLQRNGPHGAVTVAGGEREKYEQAMVDRMMFMFGRYEKASHRPSTGRGNFDVAYDTLQSQLRITVKCNFVFIRGRAADWPEAEPEDLVWDQAASDKWKADFMKVVSGKWSGKHTFFCTKPWWEDIAASVKIVFVESADKPHYDLNVMKIPEGEKRGSSVTAPAANKTTGKTKFDSEDLREHRKRAGTQTPALHEAGHMLGLGDEYPDADDPTAKVAHEALVKAEFGHGVPRTRDGRIMSNGEDIEPEHGVTFLEALRAVTAMTEWSFERAKPTPVPMPDYMDGPLPKPPEDFPRDPREPEPPDVAFA